MISACLEEDVGMVARDGQFVDLQGIVCEPPDGYPFFAKVKVDPVILREENLELGHRDGFLGFFCERLNLSGEFGEKIRCIVGSWGGFRVILDAECRMLTVSQPGDRAIVQVNMCHLDILRQ